MVNVWGFEETVGEWSLRDEATVLRFWLPLTIASRVDLGLTQLWKLMWLDDVIVFLRFRSFHYKQHICLNRGFLIFACKIPFLLFSVRSDAPSSNCDNSENESTSKKLISLLPPLKILENWESWELFQQEHVGLLTNSSCRPESVQDFDIFIEQSTPMALVFC